MSTRPRRRSLPASLASSPLTSVRMLAAPLLAAFALAGCGQMGPLVLPGDANDQGEAGTGTAAGDASAAGSEDETENSNETGGENEQ